LIIDEAHHAAARTYQNLNKKVWDGIHYRFFLTATPFRNDPEETLLFEGIAGQIIYQLTYQKAIAKGYIVPIEAYYIEIPKQKTNAYTWREVYDELIVNHKIRNETIANLMISLHESGASTLCLVKEIAHGEILADLTGAGFANGQDDDTRDLITAFNRVKIKTLIGTTGILGEGVDSKPCEYVIIAGLGKAKSAFMQQVGRSVRTYPGKESAKVILIKDTSHKFLSKHFREQCAILKDEYNIIPIKLEF
jgi:superfamily II DNA or RNA helicase